MTGVSGKNWDLLGLIPTRPPRWLPGMTAEQWQARWEGKPFRLLVTCHCEGYDPWFIQREVKIHHPDRPQVRVIE